MGQLFTAAVKHQALKAAAPTSLDPFSPSVCSVGAHCGSRAWTHQLNSVVLQEVEKRGLTMEETDQHTNVGKSV